MKRLSYSYTKKGSGRAHNYAGVRKQVDIDSPIEREYELRIKCGALTETFCRRYRHVLKLQAVNSQGVSSYKRLLRMLSTLIRRNVQHG